MSERIARAERAQAFLDEFQAPLIANLKTEYLSRITEVASTELHPTIRADKITTLSVALKVLGVLEGGIAEIIRDGELAAADKLRAERIERMSDAEQRLLRITGY